MRMLEVLALDAVQPGMKVAEAVVDDGGRVLVPVGAEVTEAMLAGLGRRDIASIKVEHEVEEDPVAREAHRAPRPGRELFAVRPFPGLRPNRSVKNAPR